jgi:alanyl-tRNA synthetase
VPDWIESAQSRIKNLEREIQSLKGKGVDVDSLIGGAKDFSVNGQKGRFVFADIPMDDRKVLSDLSDKLQSKLQSAVVVLVGQGQGSHPLVVSVSKNLTAHLNAGKILGEVAQSLGGKGGGRPDFAQGAVPNRDNLEAARQKAEELVH